MRMALRPGLLLWRHSLCIMFLFLLLAEHTNCEVGQPGTNLSVFDKLAFNLAVYYTSPPIDRLKDSSGNAMRLSASPLQPSFQSDCQWVGAECAVFSSRQPSGSGTGHYFSVPNLNPRQWSEADGFSICVWFVFDSDEDNYARIFDFCLAESR